jgi:hypothetical protein
MGGRIGLETKVFGKGTFIKGQGQFGSYHSVNLETNYRGNGSERTDKWQTMQLEKGRPKRESPRYDLTMTLVRNSLLF